MDIKAKIKECIDKIKSDPDFAKDFQKDPVKTVEKIIGADLPDAEISKVIDGIKAEISARDVKEKVGGIFGKLGL